MKITFTIAGHEFTAALHHQSPKKSTPPTTSIPYGGYWTSDLAKANDTVNKLFKAAQLWKARAEATTR